MGLGGFAFVLFFFIVFLGTDSFLVVVLVFRLECFFLGGTDSVETLGFFICLLAVFLLVREMQGMRHGMTPGKKKMSWCPFRESQNGAFPRPGLGHSLPAAPASLGNWRTRT